MTKNDDYLWDASGTADPEVERLERVLGQHRWQERPWRAEATSAGGAAHSTPNLRRSWRGVALAAGLLVALGLGAWWLARSRAGSPAAYVLETLAGAPLVDGGTAPGELSPGQRIRCDGDSRARLSVGTIGSVELEPGTELRVLEPEALEDGARFALALERGAISARITSAPRAFQVGTPAGIAVDMGCTYRASVNEAGRTYLAVDGGLVAFSTPERRIVVPAGAAAWADPERGPSTPLWNDADATLRAAVEAFDTGGGEPELFVELVSRAGADPTLVLWNLLDHPRTAVRAPAYEALARLVPPPEGSERARLLAGDQQALDRWRAELDWSW